VIYKAQSCHKNYSFCWCDFAKPWKISWKKNISCTERWCLRVPGGCDFSFSTDESRLFSSLSTLLASSPHPTSAGQVAADTKDGRIYAAREFIPSPFQFKPQLLLHNCDLSTSTNFNVQIDINANLTKLTTLPK